MDAKELAIRIAGRSYSEQQGQRLIALTNKAAQEALNDLWLKCFSLEEAKKFLGLDSVNQIKVLADNQELLEIRDEGQWWFLKFQFTNDGGVIPELLPVVKALDMSNLAKVFWLTNENSHLGYERPINTILAGEVELVLAEVVGVGFS